MSFELGVGINLGRSGEEVTPSPPPAAVHLLDDGGTDILTDDSGNELTNG